MSKTLLYSPLWLCNNNCQHCNVEIRSSSEGRRKGVANPDDVLRDFFLRLDKLAGDIDRVQIAGGEPTLYSRLSDMMEYAASKNKQILLMTNGRRISRIETLNTIARSAGAISTICVSVHSWVERVHCEIARSKKSWRETMGGLCLLTEFFPAHVLQVRIVAHRKTVPTLRDTIRFLYETFGIENFSIDMMMHGQGNARKNRSELVMPPRDLAAVFNTILADSRYSGHQVVIHRFPQCLLDPLNRRGVPGNWMNDILITEAQHGPPLQLLNATFSDECNYCSAKRSCEGIYHEYWEAFGTDWIRPILSNQAELKEIGEA